jgi:hypothetical protein
MSIVAQQGETEITGLRDTGTRRTKGSEVQPVAGQQHIVWVVGRALHHV